MRDLFCEILGKELKLPDRCERIVSLSPAVTEAFFVMGLGDKIVGVSGFCVHPEEARKKPIVGSYNRVNEKLLRSLNPDLLFTTTGYQRDMAFSLSESYPVYALPLPPSVSAIISFCVEAGKVAGYHDEAVKLETRLVSSLGRLIEKAKLPELKVYIEIDLGGPVTFGMYSYITDAFEILGLKNIYADYPAEWLKPDVDFILKADPDVIIYEPKMFGRKNRTVDEVVGMFISRGLGKLSAIRRGMVFITPGVYDFFAHHGPGFIFRTLYWLVERLKAV